MKSAKEYRMEAKQALSGKWAMAILLTIVYEAIVSALASTLVGGIILNGALIVGYSLTFVVLIRFGTLDFKSLFSAVDSSRLSATIGMYVKTAIFTFLWSLLFVIPGVVKAYSYSMAPYILADHPEMTGIESINASKQLMKGKKWKLFCLELSFIGWVFVAIITCGIFGLWLGPWMAAAKAAFYESIKDEVNA